MVTDKELVEQMLETRLREALRQIVARGWTYEKNMAKKMDPDLVDAIVEELLKQC